MKTIKLEDTFVIAGGSCDEQSNVEKLKDAAVDGKDHLQDKFDELVDNIHEKAHEDSKKFWF